MGEVDESMLIQVRQDLARIKENGCTKMTVEIYSPGGSVADGLEIVRQMLEAESNGLIIETQGGVIVASMATVLLAAGTPGYRFVPLDAIVIVHGPSIPGSFMEPPRCIEYVKKPKTEEEKVLNQVILSLGITLARLSDQHLSVTMGWLKCGQEQVGNGMLLVNLGLADAVR